MGGKNEKTEQFPLPFSEELSFPKGNGKLIYFGLESALAGFSTGVYFDANFFSQFQDTYFAYPAVLPTSLRKQVHFIAMRKVYKYELVFCLRWKSVYSRHCPCQKK